MIVSKEESLSGALGTSLSTQYCAQWYMSLFGLVITEGENRCNAQKTLYIQGVFGAKHPLYGAVSPIAKS